MKKVLALLLALALCLSLCACGTKETPSKTMQQTQTDGANASIPDAIEYDVISWPTSGAVTKIPIPSWSNRGKFFSSETSETNFWAEVGYTTLDDYRNYIEACKQARFVNDMHEENDSLFWAVNEEGYGVQLTYISWGKYLGVQVTSDAASWSKYWEN